MDDELLMAQDPDGGLGRCVPGPGMPDPAAALILDHMSVVVRDLERAVHLFKGAGVQHIAFETESLEQVEKLLDGLVVWEREPFVQPGLRVLTSKPDPVTGLVFEILERSPEEKVRLFREAEKRSL